MSAPAPAPVGPGPITSGVVTDAAASGPAARIRGSRRRALAAIALAAVAVAVVTGSAWPIYGTGRAVVVPLVAGGVGIALGVLAARARRGAPIAAVGLPAAYLVLVVPLAIPSATATPAAWLAGVRDGVAGLILGWKQLITLEPPLGEYQAVLVPLFAVALLGAFAVAALACRSDRLAFAAVPVVLAMSSFGVLFAPTTPEPGPVLALPWARTVYSALTAVLACLFWAAVHARLARVAALERATGPGARTVRGTAPRVGRGLLAGGIVAVAVLVGIAVVPVADRVADRDVLRERVDPMVVLSRVESPLTGYRAFFAGEALDRELLTVSGAEGIDRLRIATLAEYDGVRFRVDSSERGRFTRLPGSAGQPGDVEVTVTLGEGWDLPWLPIPGVITAAPRFSGPDAAELADGLAVAPGGVTAVVLTGASSAEAVGPLPGTEYTAEGSPVPAASAVLGGAEGGAPLLDPDLFAAMDQWVGLQGVPRTGAGLLELVERLRERGLLSHSRTSDGAAAGWIAALAERADYVFEPSMSGHSIARVEELFSRLVRQQVLAGPAADPSLLVAGVGDEEQFAAAVALLARLLGFESRVVVGLRLAADEPLSSVAPCRDGVCTGASLTAWVEVLGPGGQWGAVDVGPQFAVPVTRVAEGEILPEHPTTPERPESSLVAPPVSQLASSEDDPGPAEAGQGPGWLEQALPVLRVVGLVLLGLVLLVLPAIVLAVAKAARRAARRRAADPEVAVVGAWEELVDAYVDAGVVIGDRGPRRWTAEGTGREPALRLAAAADAAVFAAVPPSPADRAAAWAIVDAERRALASEAALGDRLRATLAARSFARHVGGDAAEAPTLAVGAEEAR